MSKKTRSGSIKNKGAGKSSDGIMLLKRLTSEANNSKEYNSLQKQVDKLIGIFFDNKKSFSYEKSKYRSEQKYRSFVMLFHAEIEDYLEQVAISILRQAKKIWDNESILNNALANLLILYYRKNGNAPQNRKLDSNEEIKLKEIINFSLRGKEIKISDIKKIIEKIIELQKDSINVFNHGIKWSNIERMLKPLGVPVNEFKHIDSLLTSELEELGGMRGKFVHKSAKKIKIDTYRSQDDFTRVIKYLSLFDIWLVDRSIIDKSINLK